MTDTAVCSSFVRGRRLRVTKLDSCGNPILGPTSQLVTKGFITVAFAAQNDAGTTVSVTNAAGEICVRDVPDPTFLNYNLDISLCGVDPYLISFLSGQSAVFNDASTPLATGFKVNSKQDLSSVRFALELWAGTADTACASGDKPYGYFLAPFVGPGQIGDFTVQNDAINFSISGAPTKDGNAWGVGPYNIRTTAVGAPSPLLTALDVDDHLLIDQVNVAPPAATGCGAQPLGVPATTATAGMPATLTPTNSYAPANLADLTAHPITASPTTAWTTGQYLLLRDGSKAHWNATAWVTGAA